MRCEVEWAATQDQRSDLGIVVECDLLRAGLNHRALAQVRHIVGAPVELVLPRFAIAVAVAVAIPENGERRGQLDDRRERVRFQMRGEESIRRNWSPVLFAKAAARPEGDDVEPGPKVGKKIGVSSDQQLPVQRKRLSDRKLSILLA